MYLKEQYEYKGILQLQKLHNFQTSSSYFHFGPFCTKFYITKFYKPTHFFLWQLKYLISYGKTISSLTHIREQPTCVEDTGKLRACWPLLLPLGCITVAGFCTVTVESGDEGKFAEVRDLLMITLPTTSYNEQNTMNNGMCMFHVKLKWTMPGQTKVQDTELSQLQPNKRAQRLGQL